MSILPFWAEYEAGGSAPVNHVLTGSDVESVTVLSSPALAIEVGTDSVSVQSLQSQSQAQMMTIGQDHTLAIQDIHAFSQAQSVVLGQGHRLTGKAIDSAPSLTPATLMVEAGADGFTPQTVQSLSQIPALTLGQEHRLEGQDVSVSVMAATASVGQSHVLDAQDIETSSALSLPELRHVHRLQTGSVSIVSQVSHTSLEEQGVSAVDGVDITAQSLAGAVRLNQAHTLTAQDVVATTQGLPASIQQVFRLLVDPVWAQGRVIGPDVKDFLFTGLSEGQVDSLCLHVGHEPIDVKILEEDFSVCLPDARVSVWIDDGRIITRRVA